MTDDSVSVVGAGPSGLAAAIELARQGTPVTVFEQHATVGGRFHGDFQGIENWTTEEDALAWFERLGIGSRWWCRAMEEVTLVDPTLTRRRICGDRPLLYLVERGPGQGSLDRGLERRAASLGVRFRFRRRIRPEELNGTTIIATGPRETRATVAGIIAETSHPDQVVALTRDSLAPKCYAYCIVWGGRATVASALARDFASARRRFERARAAFAQLGLQDIRNERRFGGRADICFGRALQDGKRLMVGEAAGLQDYFLGFGLRYALLSGHLAARSILSGEPYPLLVDRVLGRQFRAGFVNRMCYDHLDDAGYRHFIRWAAGAQHVRKRARRVYSLTPLHRVLWPLARAVELRRSAEAMRRQGRRHADVSTGGPASPGPRRPSPMPSPADGGEDTAGPLLAGTDGTARDSVQEGEIAW